MDIENTLLKACPRAIRERLTKASEQVQVGPRQVLTSAHDPITHCFFPLDSVISLTVTLRDGAVVETGTVGREGVLPVGALLDDDRCPFDAWCQVPGRALRLPVSAVVAECADSREFRRLAHRYSLGLAYQVARSGVCYRRHSVDERLARRLLMTHDRIEGDTLPITQEILGDMVGVTRPQISVALAALAEAGAVSRERGMIEILDRLALESAACECYAEVEREYARLAARP